MSKDLKDPAKRAAAILFNDKWYTEDETAEIIRREYAKSQWLPISTAPKDKAILTYGPSCGIYVTFWDVCGEWCEAGGEEHWTYEPTHWCPLPEPAEEETT